MNDDNIETVWRETMGTSADHCPMEFSRALVKRERELWQKERTGYRSLLRQARLLIRSASEMRTNILYKELIARIEARGVHFGD